MKPHKKVFSLNLLIIIIYACIKAFDMYFDKNDGIISDFYVNKLFIRIYSICVSISILIILTLSKFNYIRIISYNLLSGLGILFFLEILSIVYINYSSIKILPASYILFYDNPTLMPKSDVRERLYGDINNKIGRWRRSNMLTSKARCNDNKFISYQTNNIGARDINRNILGKNRIVVLGDSFSEGVLLQSKDRFSNLLESESHIEHLNFAIMGANPMAYFQIYENLIKDKFEHKAILIGIFTGNDFDNYRIHDNAKFLNSPNYRPFWKNNKVKYTLSSINHSFESFQILMNNSNPRLVIDSIYKASDFTTKIKLECETSSNFLNLLYRKINNSATDYAQKNNVLSYAKPPIGTDQIYDFELSIKAIIESAKNKNICLVLMPSKAEIEFFKKDKINRLKPYLVEKFGKPNVQIIDLMDDFCLYNGSLDSLYIPCDGHWNEKGNKFVADALMKNKDYKEIISKLEN